MPSEHALLDAALVVDTAHPPPQVKLCAACHAPLVDLPVFCPDDPLICSRCRPPPPPPPQLLRRIRPDDFICRRLCSPPPDQASLQEDSDSADMSPSSSCSQSPLDHSLDFPDTPQHEQHHLQPFPSPARVETLQHPTSLLVSSPFRSDEQDHRRPCASSARPDPLVDITRLRMRSQSHHCLYPGATFQGTQKSGRNSYDVSVTIVDVNLPYFLCGYLRIRGLTDDWPELTTYFDAEVIGSRHGFLTQKWGADESHDMMHWSRFPAFRHVKSELKQPNLTMSDRDRGAVFMRWKEKFLVPDHRVQDVNGASFAGFYYVCVDFNPPPINGAKSTSQNALEVEGDPAGAGSPPSKVSDSLRPQQTKPRRGRRSSHSTLAPRLNAPVATMNGFYYHQNSEPYQQLSLHHVPELSSSIFEFR